MNTEWTVTASSRFSSRLAGTNSLFISASCRWQEHFAVKLGEIRRHPETLSKLGAGHQDGLGRGGHPRFGVGLGIDNRDLRLDRTVVQATPSLDDLQFVTMGPAAIGLGFAQPRPFVITVG